MRLALDFDDTYTLDPAFWDSFIAHCIQHGHDVRIVTIRDDRHDRTAPLIELERRLPVIFTRGVAKSFWCLHHADWSPSIWIDDSPRSILENSTATPEWLKGWRAERGEPYQCGYCHGTGTEADYVGPLMTPVESTCSHCNGSGEDPDKRGEA